jgi:hypothetical protein
MYTYTDMGALVLNSYPPWPGGMRRLPGGRYEVPATEAPVMRFLGSGLSVARSLKNTFASGTFHSTTEPALELPNPPNGTMVVTGFFRADATETSCDRLVPRSTVTEDAAPLAAGDHRERVDEGARRRHLGQQRLQHSSLIKSPGGTHGVRHRRDVPR